VRESNAENNPTEDDDNVDNRFSAGSGDKLMQKKCGWQAFMQRIVGGEICEIDEFPWAALLLYESSGNHFIRLSHILINFCAKFSAETTNITSSACGGVLLNKKYVLTAGDTF
jgi:hypothetical protein